MEILFFCAVWRETQLIIHDPFLSPIQYVLHIKVSKLNKYCGLWLRYLDLSQVMPQR